MRSFSALKLGRRWIVKIKAGLFLAFGLVALMTLQSAHAHSLRMSGGQKLKKVKVYFYHDPGEYIDLSPVERRVSAASPARAAINALLSGPTRAEKGRGFDSLDGASEFAIGSLEIVNGTARINFVASRTWHGWAGDLGAVRFKKAVELTLKQFPNVREVIVSLNGDPKFDEG
jgi:Sporulation and spore germination